MPTEKNRLLFSLTKKDFEIQTFCTGGPGGQHKNAKQNGVRIIHTASGARAEHRTGRDQAKNKVSAFEKLVETATFKKWHKTEVARRLATVEPLSPFESETQMRERIEKRLDETMQLENLKVEYV